ncbi:putative multiple-sugar transport system permease YteP [Lactococcus lactis]|nr:putative multiple-sugar transport system permease YteP [Lactococcus lactis]
MTPTSQVKILLKKGRNGRIKEKLKNNTSLYLLLAPATILLILFAYVPMYGLLMAFKDYSPALGVSGSPWWVLNGLFNISILISFGQQF